MKIDTIKHGRMTAEEIAEIERLVSTMKKPSPGKIALRLNRRIGTIDWYMRTHGLIERPLQYSQKSYVRNGYRVNPYSAAEDIRLLALRRSGKNPREIADILTKEFGKRRSTGSVRVRLVLLATYTTEPEAA
jgi:IS30 family transposase